MFVGSVCDRLFPERVTDPPYIRTRRPLWKRHQCRFLKVLHVCRVGLRPTLSRAGHSPALHQNKTTFMETALEHDNKQRVGIFSRPFSISPHFSGGTKGGCFLCHSGHRALFFSCARASGIPSILGDTHFSPHSRGDKRRVTPRFVWRTRPATRAAPARRSARQSTTA